MPEGDAIFRAARTLNRALAGRPVTRFESVFPKLTRVHHDTPITGRTIESVIAAGKHVLMRFSGDLTLRTHMRMNGSWHVYRPGERWRRPGQILLGEAAPEDERTDDDRTLFSSAAPRRARSRGNDRNGLGGAR